MLRSGTTKKLRDPQTRPAVIAAAIKQTREGYRKYSLEKAREPLLNLMDQFEELQLDPMELLYAAESDLSGDHYWLHWIVKILLQRPWLNEQEATYLLRQALLSPRDLELWLRIFSEGRRFEEGSFYARAREQCALALLPFFEEQKPRPWGDTERREEGRLLLLRCLEETLETVLDEEREDERAQQILKAAMRLLPDRPEARFQIARLIVQNDEEPNPENLSLVLKTLATDDSDKGMKFWAARGLAKNARHAEEGIAMLRMLCQEEPENPDYCHALLSALKSQDAIGEEDYEFVYERLQEDPSDLRALELLADYYVKNEDLSEEALLIYKSAAARSPKRRIYLGMMGRASASRSEWSEVIKLLDEVRGTGEETEDIIIPLATAYAEYDRQDEKAMAVYRQAIQMGSRKPEVHDTYCRYLYLNAPSEPESVAVFLQSARDCPECAWAQLGAASHYAATGDTGRALDAALGLVRRNAGDMEAIRLCAEALAKDFSRRQLAKLADVDPAALRRIFEQAYQVAPDAGPIVMGLARRRIADGVRDEETARLIGEVCRRNPDIVDLRLARADMLWEMGQRGNAIELYRELIERWRSRGGWQLPRGINPETKRRILIRMAEWLTQPPGPSQEDIEILVEAMGEKEISAELILSTARALIDLRLDHPQKTGILRKALPFAPNDARLKRALAEQLAAEGNPRPALELAVERIREGKTGEETSNLLRSLAAVASKNSFPQELAEFLRSSLSPKDHPSSLLLAAAELLVNTGQCSEEDIPMLERLLQALPRNIRVRRWLAQCLSLAGRTEDAAKEYDSLMDHGSEDDEIVLELVRANARLGRHSPENKRLAKRAVKIRPEDPELLLYLACIELEQRQMVSAARHLNKVLELAPEMHPRVYSILEHDREVRTHHGELFLLLARVHVKAGRIEQALMALGNLQADYQRYLGDLIDVYGEIIEAAPENPRPYMERATLFRLSGRLHEALQHMDRAHRLAPDNSDILSEYADIMRQRIQSEGTFPVSAAVRCASMYLRTGEEIPAYEMVEKALKKDPENSDALRLLARLQLNANALHNAWATLKKVKNKKANLEIMQELARAFAEDDDHNMAAEIMTAAIEVGGPQKELLEQLRILYKEQARADEKAPQRQRIFGSLSAKAQGRYELREELGNGAMGLVYKAYDRELDEIVVLKILPDHFNRDAKALARFRNEAKAARKLAHPHICRIHDIGEEGGRRHISMEYVAGGDLTAYLAQNNGKLSPPESIRVIRQTARALAHAHSEGVLHRDIKAANILMTPSAKVKLSDFGIASLVEAANEDNLQPSSPMVIGTPLYMSPEQFDAKSPTPASDLYSLGILFHEVLTGAPPFIRGSIPYHHRFTPPPPIHDISDELSLIIERLLRKDPRERYQSAEVLLQDLDNVPDANTDQDNTTRKG